GMDRATLGAWRDRELPLTQAQRFEAHVRACRACQQALTEMDLVGRAVRRFDPPQMQDAIWRDVQLNMQEQRETMMPARQQKTAILGGLGALAIVIVLTAVILVFTATKPEASSTQTIVATATTAPSPTATPPALGLTVAPGQDWTAMKSVTNGLHIAFGLSDPLTGYICAQTSGGQSNRMAVSVTHDGGGHWQSVTTSGPIGVNCHLTVNATDPNDIAMQTSRCFNGCVFLRAFHSSDGGRTWHELVLPVGTDPNYTAVSQPVFAGNALFFRATTPSSYPPPGQDAGRIFAVSVAGGPARWLDLSAFPSVKTTYTPLYGFGQTLYVPTVVGSQIILEKTNDVGSTWTKVVEVGNTSFPSIISASDGTTFYDVNNASHVITSTDGGEHWAEVPAMPTLDPNGQGRNIANPIAAVSDNTLYFTDDIGNITRARPGDSGLQKVTSLVQTNRTFAAVSSDRHGHAVALWASYITFPNGIDAQAAVQYRAP
nr:zf-HC2 domain-containing protein [Ktedonobacterales bacterium]